MLTRPIWAILVPFCTIFLCGLSSQAVYAQGPTISYSLERQRPVVGVPFHVTYEARWRGPADAYALVPTQPEPVSWGSARLVESSAEPSNGEQVIRYTVEFIADNAGSVSVPPYVVGYYGSEVFVRPDDDTDAAPPTQEAGPERMILRAPEFTVEIRRRLNAVGIAIAGVLVAAALIAAAVALRHRRARTASRSLGTSTVQTAQAALNLARQYRLDGKFYDYYRELARGAALLAPSVAARKLREKLERDAERVGYGALQPNEDDLEGAARDLERAMREQGPGNN